MSAERSPLNGLKISPEDQKIYRNRLRKEGMDILNSADIPRIAAVIFHGGGKKDIKSQEVVEPGDGYVGIRLSWNFETITNYGFDPQTKCDSIEIGVSVATKTLAFVQAGEISPLKGAGGKRLERGVEHLEYEKWKENPGLISEALARAIKNPQRIESPSFI
jgi:hypothetical protein